MDLTNVRVEKRTARFAPVLGRRGGAPPQRERTPAPRERERDGAAAAEEEPRAPPQRAPSVPRGAGAADAQAAPREAPARDEDGGEPQSARPREGRARRGQAQAAPAAPAAEELPPVEHDADGGRTEREETVEAGALGDEGDPAAARARKPKKKKIRVAPLPADAEQFPADHAGEGAEGADPAEPPPNPHEVISTLTLTELIDDFEGSIPSKSHKDRAKARAEKAKLKRLRLRRDELLSLGISLPAHLQNLPPESDKEEDEEEGGGKDAARKRKRTSLLDLPDRPVPSGSAAPQLRIVDGQIQIDESSLFLDPFRGVDNDMDRVAADEGKRHHVTSYTYMRRKNHAEKWTPKETETFYECLTYWGTDLTMVSKCFPQRPHKQIKLKYQREEKSNPGRVREAVAKRARCEPARFEELTGLQLDAMDHLLAFAGDERLGRSEAGDGGDGDFREEDEPVEPEEVPEVPEEPEEQEEEEREPTPPPPPRKSRGRRR
ncbi:hypothetical protein DFJ74DRAFT_770080 [Hyaloraphidium curvatum]|nr:hypothetical protein DFJ74DRAFT_770080 [Hyaloraphidium curvatum]